MKRSILILLLILLPIYVYSQVDYTILEREVNKLRDANGRAPIYMSDDLSELAEIQVKAMIEQNIFEHFAYDDTFETDRIDDTIRRHYKDHKSYIEVRITELISRITTDDRQGIEWKIANIYNDSISHMSVLLNPMAEEMGWYVEKVGNTYWIATYIVRRYYL